jgi:EAL domain-containing protein (putative c-di-GMP-specific phosphodiesterase class I)
MNSALAHDSITLHYQPLAKGRGEIVGFEALMRWHHRQRGATSPEAFIPIFEQNGLILPLSRWALKQACREAASWKHPLRITVNLSVVQFRQDDLPTLVKIALDESGLAPERLGLEMTEAALVSDPERSSAILAAVDKLGVRIALDDFGVGVSSPAYLSDYPISRIKIARSVVEKVETSVSARSIVHMIVALGRSMNVAVAAKGVETAAQLSYLMNEGCDLIQGFLVGRPASISSFAGLTGAPPAGDARRATRKSDHAELQLAELSEEALFEIDHEPPRRYPPDHRHQASRGRH